MSVTPMSPCRLEKHHLSADCLFSEQHFRAIDLTPLNSFAFPVGTRVAFTVALQKENGGAV
jgi:hypothetical protein